MMDNVLTVYLDQNKWIELARAENGHALGAPFVDTLAVLKGAADEGRVRFPLSSAHYYETGKQRDRAKRMKLSRTMVRLAGQLRIAPPHAVVPWEIRQALDTVFDLAVSVPALELFGTGVAHAFAVRTFDTTHPLSGTMSCHPSCRMPCKRAAKQNSRQQSWAT